ncbi:MAG: histidine phosphatase family protein [Pseudomonadota bacterium]
MALILMRHTRPVLDSTICYGRLDIPLADTFESELQDALSTLPPFDQIVSSPLQRAKLLAERIADSRNVRLHLDERIAEMDFGAWEGVAWSQIPRQELDAWAADFLDANIHGGESVRMFHRRCSAAAREYARAAGDTLVVCHAGVVRAVFANGNRAEDFSKSIDYGHWLYWSESDKKSRNRR